MSITGKGGFVFSLDLLVAFIVMLLIFCLILLNYSSLAEENANAVREYALQKNAIFLLDNIVKNSPPDGAAYFDPEKRRVLSNELSFAALEEIGGMENGEFFIKEISLQFKDGASEILFEKRGEGEVCIALNRFVLVEGRKALLHAVICDA